ncbi:hypothetical protein ACP70R_008087 [Stipagrostis hirtigluma subsp. patula]
MALVKKGTSVPSLAVLMVMAMAAMTFFSLIAADHCELMEPCDQDMCFNLCVAKNYTGNFLAYCTPELLPPHRSGCCCRVSGAGGA